MSLNCCSLRRYSGYKWCIEFDPFVVGGDIPQLSVFSNSSLFGLDAAVESSTTKNGSFDIEMKPIPAHLLRVPTWLESNRTTGIQVTVNGSPASTSCNVANVNVTGK